MPLNHLLATELGSAIEGEPQNAPIRSYELLWRRLYRKYTQDCEEIIQIAQGCPKSPTLKIILSIFAPYFVGTKVQII